MSNIIISSRSIIIQLVTFVAKLTKNGNNSHYVIMWCSVLTICVTKYNNALFVLVVRYYCQCILQVNHEKEISQMN